MGTIKESRREECGLRMREVMLWEMVGMGQPQYHNAQDGGVVRDSLMVLHTVLRLGQCIPKVLGAMPLL